MRLVGVLLLVLAVSVPARAELVVLYDSARPPDGVGAMRLVPVPDWPSLRQFSSENGVKPGIFPCVVDLETKLWLPVQDGEAVSSVAAEIASDESWSRVAESRRYLRDAKSEAKSPSLKQAENKLIKFLRDEGAIAAGAVEATADEIDAMFANWEATLNDAQLEKKSAKYDRLLRAVERRGGTELGARYH